MAATNENSTVAALPEGTVAAEPPKGTGVTPDEATICTAAGIKPYPGAKEVKPLETKLDQAGDSRYEYSFTTTDPRKKIGEFYSEFGLSGAAESPKAVLIGKTKSGQDVIVGLQDKDGATQVAIKAIVYKKK